MAGDTIIRFDNVSFEYGQAKKILDEVSFSIRRGTKITFMGQNGAGKSTIFQLITGEIQPEEGNVNIGQGVTIAHARQIIPPKELELSVREFFEKVFDKKVYDIDPKIDAVLDAVNLQKVDHDKKIKTFSGGQQARLL